MSWQLVVFFLIWTLIVVVVTTLLSRRIITTSTELYAELHTRTRAAEDYALALERQLRSKAAEAKADVKKIIT